MPEPSRKKTLAAVALTLLGTLALASVAVVAVAYSGAVDVAATHHPSAFMRWFFQTTRSHSVTARAKGIQVPNLGAPGLISIGAHHYQEMCVSCHAAPGVEPSEAAQGLEPPPPELYKGPAMTRAAAAETFWVVKNGIQMTGMPGFGKTHDDKKIWAIVAFVKRLHGMTPAEFKKLTRSSSHGGEGDDHKQGP